MPNEPIDVLCLGETVVDLISLETTDSLYAAEHFRRHLGGSPANIAVTVARLGGRAAIVSKCGDGAFGRFARSELETHGVITDYLRNDPSVHTTVIFIARTPDTPDFRVFREGDVQLCREDIPEEAIARAKVVHASTFALSHEPCRSTVIWALRHAAALEKLVSLDPNYHPQIWSDGDQARDILRSLYKYVSLTKPSLDDAVRLFGAGLTPEAYLDRFHDLGPRTVVLTLGRRGTLLSHNGAITQVPARVIEAADATGAGDAFWGGFLLALVDGLSPSEAAQVASEVVAAKLQSVGPLSTNIDRLAIYQRIKQTTRGADIP